MVIFLTPHVHGSSKGGGATFFLNFSALLSKQKLLRMSTGCQKDRQTESQTDRKPNRQIDRQTDRKTDRKTERKTERFFSLLIKTKVVQNVNWMSER